MTTLGTFSNLQAGGGYTQQTFNLTPFRGQTVQIENVRALAANRLEERARFK